LQVQDFYKYQQGFRNVNWTNKTQVVAISYLFPG